MVEEKSRRNDEKKNDEFSFWMYFYYARRIEYENEISNIYLRLYCQQIYFFTLTSLLEIFRLGELRRTCFGDRYLCAIGNGPVPYIHPTFNSLRTHPINNEPKKIAPMSALFPSMLSLFLTRYTTIFRYVRRECVCVWCVVSQKVKANNFFHCLFTDVFVYEYSHVSVSVFSYRKHITHRHRLFAHFNDSIIINFDQLTEMVN